MVKAQMTKIALIQMRCGPEPEENFKRAIQFIRDAAKKGAQIICLPELFRSEYFCQTEDHKNFGLAEEIPGKSTSALGEVARELDIVIIASLFEKRGAGEYSAWETIQRGHAIANGCYVAAANRVGHEAPAGGEGIEFWGQSFVAAPSGEIIAKGSVDREEIVMADVEWDQVNEHRTHWPFLRDRRVDAYAGIEKRMID